MVVQDPLSVFPVHVAVSQDIIIIHQSHTNAISYLFHVKIDFVSNNDKWEVVRVAWTGLYQKLVTPAVESAECGSL